MAVSAKKNSAAKHSARTTHAPTTTLPWTALTPLSAMDPDAPPTLAATKGGSDSETSQRF